MRAKNFWEYLYIRECMAPESTTDHSSMTEIYNSN